MHPSPGSNVSLETSTSSSGSYIHGMSALTDHLNNVQLNHVNKQSMYPKRDILEVEMQYYNIAVLTRIPESATDIQAGATVYFGYKRFF